MRDLEIQVGGRTVGATDYGPEGAIPVLWCHGGPGSRREPEALAPELGTMGYRVIGIDRPGYGASTPNPGRSIADWVPDGIAVADHLGIDQFAVVGVSTGGAYALALAARHAERVSAVVACCALTDMQSLDVKALMMSTGNMDIWSAPDRASARRVAADLFGEDGSKMGGEMAGESALPESDMALFTDPIWLTGLLESSKLMFAHGTEGYADDRIADGVGWVSFDVGAVRCPVTVLHGDADTICPVANAHHTAAVVPGAVLDIRPGLGHFSIVNEVPGVLHSL
jgi:pimeloyl-ACP methyl ester carboxylesterase